MNTPHLQYRYGLWRFANPMPEIKAPADDEEYISLRNERNIARDSMLVNHERGSVKHFDNALEVYEREKGTIYCEAIYLKSRHYMQEYVNDNMKHAGGDVICEVCKQPYKEHEVDKLTLSYYPHLVLHKICTGFLAKL
jgi:hypothetical protein